jgi:hypothetical protein
LSTIEGFKVSCESTTCNGSAKHAEMLFKRYRLFCFTGQTTRIKISGGKSVHKG